MTYVVYNRQKPVDIELCRCKEFKHAVGVARLAFDGDETATHVFVNEEDSDGCVLRESIWEARR